MFSIPVSDSWETTESESIYLWFMTWCFCGLFVLGGMFCGTNLKTRVWSSLLLQLSFCGVSGQWCWLHPNMQTTDESERGWCQCVHVVRARRRLPSHKSYCEFSIDDDDDDDGHADTMLLRCYFLPVLFLSLTLGSRFLSLSHITLGAGNNIPWHNTNPQWGSREY